MGQLSSAQIDKQIDQLRQAILKEEEDHRKMAFEYTETGDTSLMEKMTNARNTINFYRDTISANEVARQVAIEREEKEFNAERERELRQRIDDSKKLLGERVKVAEELDAKFNELGELMKKFRVISEQCLGHHVGLMDRSFGFDFKGASLFNHVPQVFGWRNAIHRADLADLAGPNFRNKYTNDSFPDISLADAIRKQHEGLRIKINS